MPQKNVIAGLSLMLLSLVNFPPAIAQSQEKLYAVMLLNFAKGLQWPNLAEDDDFKIGVLEYPPLVNELKSSAQNVKILSKPVDIVQLSSVDDVAKCKILFIPAYKAKVLDQLLSKVKNAPVLIVTNKFDFARKGSGINFILVDGKPRYEINVKSIEKRGIKISFATKSLGIEIE